MSTNKKHKKDKIKNKRAKKSFFYITS